jgi:hypothetical protein
VAGRVDAARHATNNDQSLGGKIAGKALSHARAIRRGMTRADHGDPGLGQHVGIAADIQDEGRIIDFFQARRVRGIVHRDDGHAGSGGLGDLFAGEFGRLARGQRLSGDGLNAGGLEFGERGAEDSFGASEVLDQLSGLGGSETLGQRNGQPFQQIRGRRRRYGGQNGAPSGL